MKTKIAINGFGRIGRAFYKLAVEQEGIEIVAINDLMSRENAEYLLKHDSVYKSDRTYKTNWTYLSESDPSKLPWKELGVDIVVEATGFFASAEKAQAHLNAGAKKVVITAPIKDGETILIGINEEKLKEIKISSNASCTTNAASPVIAILDEKIGIEKAILNTVHAYTATQSLVDGPAIKRGFRDGRAAAQNIIPSSTGAAISVTKAYPKLDGKFDGISIRVPVVCGSIADITFVAKRDTTAQEVNDILREAAKEKRWKGIFSASDEELVSSDIIGASEGAIAELSMTRVVDGNLVKVLAWYDNEVGYANTLLMHVLAIGRFL